MQTVHESTIGSLKTRWADEGTGDPVVLVHGGGLGYTLEVWSVVSAVRLAALGWRAIAVDLPGCGDTELLPSDGSYSNEDFLADVAAEIGKGRVHLVGHSVNGNFVINLAVRSPELLSSVTAIGTGSLLPRPAGSTEAPAPSGGAASAAEPQPPTLDEVRANLRKDVYDASALTDVRVQTVYDMSIGRHFADSLARRAAGRNNRAQRQAAGPLWERLGEIKVPVMAVFGDGDKNGAGEGTPLLAEACPSVRVHLIANCRHLVQWDAPDLLAEYLDEFLRVAP